MERAHIAMVSFPAQGQITPMMRLACRLACLGDVRITFFACEWFVEAALGARESACEDLIQVVSIPKGAVNQEGVVGSDSGIVEMLRASQEMREPFEELLAKLVQEGHGVQCLVSDINLGWPQDTADKLGIPNAGLWAGSTTCAIFMVVLKDLMLREYVPVQDKMAMVGNVHLGGMIPGMQNLHLADIPFLFHPRDPEGLEMCAAIGQRMQEAACILLSTCDVEKDAVQGLQGVLPCPCWSVGPLLPAAVLESNRKEVPAMKFGGLVADKSCMEWLDKQPPCSVLYVSFGSLANVSMAQFKELALGLEASKAPFLWVVRPNLVQEGREAVEDFFQEFLSRSKGQGTVVTWAPQLQVLGHPSIALFMTHCGWNSTMEAIWNSVPLVAWPSFDEQNINARYIVSEWKIGVPVNEKVMCESGAFVSSQEVEAAIHLGLNDEKIRDNMKVASFTAKSGVKQDGSSLKNLQKFVTAVKTASLISS